VPHDATTTSHATRSSSSSVRRPRRPNPTPRTPVTRGKSARAGCRARDAICPRGPRPARGATPRPFLRVPAARRGAPRRHRRPPAARGRLHLTSGVRMRPRYLLVRRRLAGRLAFAAWPDLVRFRSVELAPRPTDGWGLGLIARLMIRFSIRVGADDTFMWHSSSRWLTCQRHAQHACCCGTGIVVLVRCFCF